ncbi:MAG: type IV pilus assembly protein PilM [Candidatus Pacebacteria bacterium]|nr:type IV pilus assembly protein PilM [Candidatus Paceibacterota bacterium]
MEFNFKKRRAIGIDISDASIKIVGLEKTGNAIKVFCFGKEKVPRGAVEKGEIKDERILSEVIKQAMKNLAGGAFKLKKVFVSLPEEKSFVDVITIPFLPEDKIFGVVSFEAENVIPFPLSEVYFDFEKIETTAKLAKCQEVLLVATPRKIVDAYFNAIKMAGLTPLAMEMESLSIGRALTEKEFFSSPLLLVDFGETRTTLAIFAGKNLRFTSTIPISSRQLTKSIAAFLEIPLLAAEHMKKKEGLNGKKEAFEAMVPFLTDMTEQIKHYLDYYQTHSAKCQEFDRKKGLQKIILCGSGAILKGLVGFLASELKIAVELGDPLLNISDKKIPEGFTREKSLGYTTAIGLALRNI